VHQQLIEEHRDGGIESKSQEGAHRQLDEGVRQVGRLAGRLDRAANGRKERFLLRLIFAFEQRQNGIQEGYELGPGMSDGIEVQGTPPEMPFRLVESDQDPRIRPDACTEENRSMGDGMKLGRALSGLILERPTGEPVPLADLWRGRPVVLVWIRHFG